MTGERVQQNLIETFQQGTFPFLDLLGVEPVEIGDARASIRLRVEDRHLRVGGIAHGGVVASLLDTAVGLAAATVAPHGHDLVTAQLNVNFIRPVNRNEVLIATGQVLHAGNRTAVCRGEIFHNEQLLAEATATVIYLPHVEGREVEAE
ncbi:MAG: PaaI family thioesterase [Maioricimonas sp. JB049]